MSTTINKVETEIVLKKNDNVMTVFYIEVKHH